MSCRRLVGLCTVALALAAPDLASAQARRERPTVRAALAPDAPKIDGVLDEAAWQSATPSTPSCSRSRTKAQPATDRTEVRVLYDSKHLYIGVHAHRRRSRSWPPRCGATPIVCFDEDNFQVIIDTFHDSRNGYMFLTTPLGAKLEQQVFDEGEGGGRGTTLERQPQLGRRLGHRRPNRQRRLDRGDLDSASTPFASPGATSRSGASTSSAHPPQERIRCSGRRSRRPTP